MKNLSPIFIHSLFRSGSTYIFNAFRRADAGYWCYQEPMNEYLINVNGDAEKLLENTEGTVIALRHPHLNRPYYWEYFHIKDGLKGLFHKSFSYDLFFVDPDEGFTDDQAKYFDALISYAKGRPVLQFCRSAGRIAVLKKTFGGLHIHLWRDPRKQWWSFKVNSYFDAVVQRIYNADKLPPVLDQIRKRCEIIISHHDDTQKEIEDAQKHPFDSKKNYYVFYSLWLYAFLECQKYADLTINIDLLSFDNSYRELILRRLLEVGVNGLDFSDCSVPRAVFTKNEVDYFSAIETQVQDQFLLNGYVENEINCAIAECEKVSTLSKKRYRSSLRDVAYMRELCLRFLDQHAQAEARSVESEERAVKAEECAAKADEREAQSAERATKAERYSAQLVEEAEKMALVLNNSEEQVRQANAKIDELADMLVAISAELDVWKKKPMKSAISHYYALIRK